MGRGGDHDPSKDLYQQERKASDPLEQRPAKGHFKRSYTLGGKTDLLRHESLRKVSDPVQNASSLSKSKGNPVRVRRKKRYPSMKKSSLTERKKSRAAGDLKSPDGEDGKSGSQKDRRGYSSISSAASENLSGILRRDSVTSYNGVRMHAIKTAQSYFPP